MENILTINIIEIEGIEYVKLEDVSQFIKFDDSTGDLKVHKIIK